MAYCTLIIGESGTGKSSSFRNLDPSNTFILNTINKPLPFKGGALKYSIEKKNYYSSEKPQNIINCIQAVNERLPNIKNLIIDDFQYIMGLSYFSKAHEKGYERFITLGQETLKVINAFRECRDDLQVFVLSHSDTDDHGIVRCKTVGKMIDNYIKMEGMFSMILHSQIVDGQYKFMVKGDGRYIARSPMGMFEESYIDNDLNEIRKIIHEYHFDENAPKVTFEEKEILEKVV